VNDDTAFDYVRVPDFEALTRSGSGDSIAMVPVFGHSTGATHCLVNAIVFPPDTGTPDSWHVHAGDQVFYIVSGTMTFEIGGERFHVQAGQLQIAPAGVPHRNWNAGPGPVHVLSFNAPLPDPALPIATPVEAPSA